MASSPSGSLLFEVQAAGENLNTWGAPRLNTALKMLEAAGHGLTSHTLTGDVSLTYTNYTLTNGTDLVQKIASASDGSYTLTLGGYERAYLILNASSFSQTIACSGGGASVTIRAGEIVPVYCDGTNVHRANLTFADGDVSVTGALSVGGAINVSGNQINSVADPTANQDAATKKYVDDTAFDAAGGNLPGQPGNAGKSIHTDGSQAAWEFALAAQSATTNRQFLQSTGSDGKGQWADLNGPLYRWRRKRA